MATMVTDTQTILADGGLAIADVVSTSSIELKKENGTETDASPPLATPPVFVTSVHAETAETNVKGQKSKKKKSYDSDAALSKYYDDETSDSEDYPFRPRERTPGRRHIEQFSKYFSMVESRLAELETTFKDLQRRDTQSEDRKEEQSKEDVKEKVTEEESTSDVEEKPESDSPEPEPKPKCEMRLSSDPTWYWRIEHPLPKPQKEIKHDASSVGEQISKLVTIEKSTPVETFVIEVLQSSESGVSASEPTTQHSKATAQYPVLIRLRSRHLIEFLEKATSTTFKKSDVVVNFASPFKLFAKYGDQIAKACALDLQSHDAESISASTNAHSVQSDVSGVSDHSSKSENGQPAIEDSSPIDHLRLFAKLLEGPLAEPLARFKELRSDSATSVSFRELWYLFGRGDEIIAADRRQETYRVRSTAGGRTLDDDSSMLDSEQPDRSKDKFLIDSYRYAYDGTQYGLICPEPWSIWRFSGRREILSLRLYPLRFDKEARAVRARTDMAMGRFRQLICEDKYHHRNYVGPAFRLMPPAMGNEEIEEEMEEVDSPVVIDQQLAFRRNPRWKPRFTTRPKLQDDEREIQHSTSTYKCSPSCGCSGYLVVKFHDDFAVDKEIYENFFLKHKSWFKAADDLNEIPREDHVLLPMSVYGFVLRSREWMRLALEHILDIDYSNSFERLVLPEGHVETIKALVEVNNSGNRAKKPRQYIDTSMDLIRGKGQGLIILLHGEPGVGKTSTAECIADYTKRPLFSITCGDIGTDASQVEVNLASTFELARKWGCVLLLDEADVFLEERSRQNLERNAIVSVFLRALEYYSGILFLTTNRVGSIDPAFRSRLHLTLYYPKLTIDATRTLWQKHLDTIKQRYEKNDRQIEMDDMQILWFASDHFAKCEHGGASVWNGRQIRNAFQAALALAEFEAQGSGEASQPKITRLTRKHFEKIEKTSAEFDKYLRRTQGMTPEGRAKQQMLRDDYNEKSGQTSQRPQQFYNNTRQGSDMSPGPGQKNHQQNAAMYSGQGQPRGFDQRSGQQYNDVQQRQSVYSSNNHDYEQDTRAGAEQRQGYDDAELGNGYSDSRMSMSSNGRLQGQSSVTPGRNGQYGGRDEHSNMRDEMMGRR